MRLLMYFHWEVEQTHLASENYKNHFLVKSETNSSNELMIMVRSILCTSENNL